MTFRTYKFTLDIDIDQAAAIEDSDYSVQIDGQWYDHVPLFLPYLGMRWSDSAVGDAFTFPLNDPTLSYVQDIDWSNVERIRNNKKGVRPNIRTFSFEYTTDPLEFIAGAVRDHIDSADPSGLLDFDLRAEPSTARGYSIKKALTQYVAENKEQLITSGWYEDLHWYRQDRRCFYSVPAPGIEEAILSQAFQQARGYPEYDPEQIAEDLYQDKEIRDYLLRAASAKDDLAKKPARIGTAKKKVRKG